MKREDAIKLLKRELDLRDFSYTDHLAYGGKEDKIKEQFIEAFSMAIAALEFDKQEPRKPVLEHKNYHCPICGKWLLWDDAEPNENDNFCGRCGQAIDWTDLW